MDLLEGFWSLALNLPFGNSLWDCRVVVVASVSCEEGDLAADRWTLGWVGTGCPNAAYVASWGISRNGL